MENQKKHTEFLDIIQNNSFFIQDINSVTITQGIKTCYLDKDEDIMEETKEFREHIKQKIAMIENYINNQHNNQNYLELALAILMKSFYRTMEKIAEHSYYILTGPLIFSMYATYEGITNEELTVAFKLLGKEYKLSKKNSMRKMYVMLNLAYLNIQKQNYKQAFSFIEQLDRSYDNLQIEMQSNSVGGNKQLNFNQKDDFQNQKIYLFIQMIKSLYLICTNKLDELGKQIDFQKQKIDQITDSKLQEKANINYILINSYFLKNQKNQLTAARSLLKKISDPQLKEGCLLFFNNPNKFCVQLLEFLFSCVQVDILNEAVLRLQRIEIQNQKVTSEDIQEIEKLMSKYEGEDYLHGKLNILQQTNIASFLYRIANQYENSIEQIKSYRFLINPPPKISFYMNYQFQLSQMFQKVKNNDNQYSASYTQFKCDPYIQQGGQGKIEVCKDDELNTFIAKGVNSNMNSLILLMSEASMQQVLNHRYIQKNYDILIQNDKVYILSIKQGNNLEQLLQNETIPQDTRNGYVFQILHAFMYLNLLSILHSDLKLSNLVVVKGNNKKIKVIDFGMSQINLSDNQFKALGGTKQYCPFEIVNKNSCDLDADIYMIGKIIDFLFINFKPQDKIQSIKNNFLISQRLKELIKSLINQNKEKRPSITTLFKLFRYDVFIQKLYSAILQLNLNQIDYIQFSDKFYIQFDKFLDYKYQSYLLSEDKLKWKKKTVKQEGVTQKIIIQALLNLINSDDYLFIDCCFEKDIYNFIIEFIKDSQQLDSKIKELQMSYKNEDDESKTEMKFDNLQYDNQNQKPLKLGKFADFQKFSAEKQKEIREILEIILKQCREDELKKQNEQNKFDCQQTNQNEGIKLQQQNINNINQTDQIKQNYIIKKNSLSQQISNITTKSFEQSSKIASIKQNVSNLDKSLRNPQLNNNSQENSQISYEEYVSNHFNQFGPDLDIEMIEISSQSTDSRSNSFDSNRMDQFNV